MSEWRSLVLQLASYAYHAALDGGTGSPLARRNYDDVFNVEPRPGDIVYEITTRVGIGRFIRKEQRPFELDEPWDEAAEGRPHPTEEVWIINPLFEDEEEQSWANARFVRMPLDRLADWYGMKKTEAPES